jgi:hypothetical protein
VDILLVLLVLQLALMASAWSCAKSYFEKGRLRGLEQATQESVRGAQSHLACRGKPVPDAVSASIASIGAMLDARAKEAYEPPLWAFGNALGEACWRNGYDAGVEQGAIPEGKIRIELAAAELLQVTWLAHLGFQHMMPNYRGFDVHRFSGSDDAHEGARSVALLECALPRRQRPFADIKTQICGREKLIADWWMVGAERRLA